MFCCFPFLFPEKQEHNCYIMGIIKGSGFQNFALFRHFFLLIVIPASEFYVPAFRNTAFSLFVGNVSRKNNLDETVNAFPDLAERIFVYIYMSSTGTNKRQTYY